MADPFVSFVVERLGDFLIQEGKFLLGVRGRVQEMQDELTQMQCFLKDADARREENASVENWVGEIREAAYDAGDVIETFIIKVAFRRRSGILNVLMRFPCISKDCVARHKVGVEIESIKTKISTIRASFETYGIRTEVIRTEGESSMSSRQERQRILRQSYHHIMEDDIVGFDKDRQTIVEHLVKEEGQCWVVSIWGMGGIGKTTLAKMVYNHPIVKQHFDRFAWVYVSQQCKTREVLQEILFRLTSPSSEERESISKMVHAELVEKLYDVQSRMKCLVVLDDIWSNKDWSSLSPAFPIKKAGSKILLTTRIREVALRDDEQCLHELRLLTEAESWELFEKKACLRRNVTEYRVNKEMIMLGEEMVRHCRGLPLAIVVLAGLLVTKDNLDEWKNVRTKIGYYLRISEGQLGVPVTDVLALSYEDLPYHLKACFLYLSHLPEDEDIHPEKLVQMWMAEGFVSSPIETRVGGVEETMLDVGRSYLEELVHRSMLQVHLTRFSRRIKLCRLHDLIGDLCLLKARKENFVKVVLMHEDFESSSSSSSPAKIRRLAVHYLGDRGSGSTRRGYGHHHHVRSCHFYFFGERLKDSDWQEIESLLEGFKFIRVLDLQGIRFIYRQGNGYPIQLDPTKRLPEVVGNLIHLRYLSIKDSFIQSLPPSIGNLGFLQTLDLRVNEYVLWSIPNVLTIPNVLWKLGQLRHLYLPRNATIHPSFEGGGDMLRLDGLIKLETLEGVSTSYVDVSCLSKLTNLRKLEVGRANPEDLVRIFKSPVLSNSSSLLRYSSFFIAGDFKTQEEQSLRQLFGCRHLHKLRLRFFQGLRKLPDQFPPNLTKLTLENSGLKEDPMPTLEKFPNLTSLTLDAYSYSGKQMVCSAPSPTAPTSESGGSYGCGGFRELKFLCLSEIEDLEEWRVEKGAMPNLLRLEICFCWKLKKIPNGLRFVTTLRELYIVGESPELKDRLQQGGEDFNEVRHVPSITIC